LINGRFKLVSDFKPTGDQPQAIELLANGLSFNREHQLLLGVTGSGKTFTLANVIEKVNRPTLIISHNKTLAGQLYSEFKEFFPHNAVEYFVSYYDYYQPESYIPQTDTYIEKDAAINDKLDRLRLSATSSLLSRCDVIVVASVSCIYNLGSPQDYENLVLKIEKGQKISITQLARELVRIQYERNDFDFKRATFRVKGDTVDIFPAYKERGIRVEFFGDEIDRLSEIDVISAKKIEELSAVAVYPAKHFVMGDDLITPAVKEITAELDTQLKILQAKGKIVEAERLKRRTMYDMEMLQECGYCHGIENYARHLSGRPAGSRPYCLIDYFPHDFVTIIDESHVTLPQLRGMFEGDKSRKNTLVEYGFRLPSCLDNRPLKFDELKILLHKQIFVSATPAKYEFDLCDGKVVEQIIRPTGIIDPEIEVRKTANQIDDLIAEIKARAAKNERTLITTITKRMAEQLSEYLEAEGVDVTYLHSDIDTIERAKILQDLRRKKVDCLIGINLLREGLDLPEVSLVAILDADKEGFLRSTSSLIQVSGRAARNVNGKVIMYADTITDSMRQTIKESERRRKKQLAYNKEYKITPKTIQRAIKDGIETYFKEEEALSKRLDYDTAEIKLHDIIAQLEKDMFIAAKNLHFEQAAQLRDKIEELKKQI